MGHITDADGESIPCPRREQEEETVTHFLFGHDDGVWQKFEELLNSVCTCEPRRYHTSGCVARFRRLGDEGRAAFVLGAPKKGIRKDSNCDGHKSKAGAIALAAISVLWNERNRAKTAITESPIGHRTTQGHP